MFSIYLKLLKRACLVFISISIILLLVSGATYSSPFFQNKSVVYAQLIQDKSSSRLQRLGTDNILVLPYGVKLFYGVGQNMSIDQEFILLGYYPRTPLFIQHNVAVSNPDYGLREPVPVLRVGERFVINSTVIANVKYTSAAVMLAPITSHFPPTNRSISDVDPEVDLVFSNTIKVGTYAGSFGNFVIPQTVKPGYYLLYVYLQYPRQNMVAVYNAAVQITNGSSNTSTQSIASPSVASTTAAVNMTS